jgi:hypothetical protein
MMSPSAAIDASAIPNVLRGDGSAIDLDERAHAATPLPAPEPLLRNGCVLELILLAGDDHRLATAAVSTLGLFVLKVLVRA